jgi:hypothetical protein
MEVFEKLAGIVEYAHHEAPAPLSTLAMLTSLFLLAASLGVSQTSAGQAKQPSARTRAPNPLKLTVDSVEIGTRFQAYLGGGTNISPPMQSGGWYSSLRLEEGIRVVVPPFTVGHA